MKVTDYSRRAIGTILGTVSNSTAIGGVSASSNTIPSAGQIIVAVGSNLFEWRDGISFGSNTNDVSSVGTMGSSPSNTRADHVHRGVHSITAAGSNSLYGDVNLVAGTNMAITAGGNSLTFASTGGTGVTGITANSSNTLTGGVNLQAGSGIALGVAASTITITNTAQGGGGGGSAGALVFLQAQTASASATLDFTTAITSTYDEYLVELINVIPATNSVTLYMRFSTDGGSSYLATSYGWNHLFVYGAGTSGAEGSTSDVAIAVSGGAVASAGNGVSGTLRLYDPGASGTTLKVLTKDTTRDHTSVGLVHDNGSGYRSVAAVNAFRFLFSSGNITSGTIRVYGIAKS